MNLFGESEKEEVWKEPEPDPNVWQEKDVQASIDEWRRQIMENVTRPMLSDYIGRVTVPVETVEVTGDATTNTITAKICVPIEYLKINFEIK